MNIGLIDVDSHNFPNLALMKLSAYHKNRGDQVEWWNGLKHYDIVYKSRIFTDTYSEDVDYCINADKVVKGGTGYDLKNKLPEEIEHQYPDYSLYDIKDKAYGFLTRGCPRSCPFCIVSSKEGENSHTAAELSEWWQGQNEIILLDPNLLACKEHEELLQQLVSSNAFVDFSQGLDARLLTKENIGLINKIKLKNIHFAWDFMEQSDKVIGGLDLYKRFGRKVGGAFGTVYVLTNYNTSHDEDMYRVITLRDMGFKPYVMIYEKPKAPAITKKLQGWVNNKIAFNVCDFEDFSSENRKLNSKR